MTCCTNFLQLSAQEVIWVWFCFLKRMIQLRTRKLLSLWNTENPWLLTLLSPAGLCWDQCRMIRQSTPEIRNWVLSCPYAWANVVNINSLRLSHEAVSQCMDSASCSSCPTAHCAWGCSSQTTNSWSSVTCRAHLYRISCLIQIPKSSRTTWLLPNFMMLLLEKWWDHFIGVCVVGTGSKTRSLLGLLP